MSGGVRGRVLAHLAKGPASAGKLARDLGLNVNSLYVMLPIYERRGWVKLAEGSTSWGRVWELTDTAPTSTDEIRVSAAITLLEKRGFIVRRAVGETIEAGAHNAGFIPATDSGEGAAAPRVRVL